MPHLPIIHAATAALAGLTLGMIVFALVSLRPGMVRSSVGAFLMASLGLFLLSVGQFLRAAAPDAFWMDVALRLSQSSTLLVLFAIGEVFRHASKSPFTRLHRIAAISYAVLGLYSLLSPGGYLYEGVEGVRFRTYSWGESVSIPDADYSDYFYAGLLTAVLGTVVVGTSAIALYRREKSLRAVLLGSAVLFNFVFLAFTFRRYLHHDNSPMHTDLAVVPALLLACHEALSQLRAWTDASRRAVLSMQESQSRLSALVGNAQTLTGLLEPSGNIVEANARALSSAGVSLGEVVGTPFWTAPWWSHSSALQSRVKLAVERAALGKADRFQGTHHDQEGGEIVVDFSLTPYRDDSGEVKWLIAEGRDVTDLVKYQERARAEQRLEVIGQLAGGVAHDFNNMLSGIIGAAELAKAESKDQDVIDNLSVVLSAAERAASLTKQLLHFARRGGTRNETYVVDDHVKATVQLFERTSGKALRVELRLAGGETRVLGDPALLQSAILNLLVNARDALGEGGAIVVSTSRKSLAQAAAGQFNQPIEPGEYLELSVLDNGEGIATEILPKIFEPFFTTKEIGKGTGLGLAAVMSSIRDHRGAIRVESRKNEGTRFDIYLPIAGAASENESKIRAYAPAYAYGKRALLVDDEPIVRNSMTRMLKHLGYVVTTAEDGLDALSKLNQPEEFELAVLDYHMPQMNGADFAQALRAKYPQLPIVIMSGNFGDKQLDELKKDVRARQLAKPARREDLVTVLLELGAIVPRR